MQTISNVVGIIVIFIFTLPLVIFALKLILKPSGYNLGTITTEEIHFVLTILLGLEKQIGQKKLDDFRRRTLGLKRPSFKIEKKPNIVVGLQLLRDEHFVDMLRKWAKWMGLKLSTVGIRLVYRPNEKFAGRAHLDSGLVEVNVDATKHPEAFLTVVSHEFAHLLLKSLGIHAAVRSAEEPLTDLTCVYVGLGDVMLNGCISTHVTSYQLGDTTYTNEQTLQVGYVPPLVIAMATIFMMEACKNISRPDKPSFSCSSKTLLAQARRSLVRNGIDVENRSGYSPAEYFTTQLHTIEEGMDRDILRLRRQRGLIRTSWPWDLV